MDGIHRINRGPITFVQEYGSFFQIATGARNFWSTGLR
jgi:hypothetical protein